MGSVQSARMVFPVALAMPRRRYLWHRSKETADGKTSVFVYMVIDPEWKDFRYEVEVIETKVESVSTMEEAYVKAFEILRDK